MLELAQGTMDKICFVDTSYLVALLHKKDEWHRAAVYWRDEVIRNHVFLITTEYVLVELANGLSALRFRKQAEGTIMALQNSPDVKIIPGSNELFNAGFSIYCKYPDKGWSLTDCISFAVMKKQGLNEVLATDKHFNQAGFKVLLHEKD